MPPPFSLTKWSVEGSECSRFRFERRLTRFVTAIYRSPREKSHSRRAEGKSAGALLLFGHVGREPFFCYAGHTFPTGHPLVVDIIRELESRRRRIKQRGGVVLRVSMEEWEKARCQWDFRALKPSLPPSPGVFRFSGLRRVFFSLISVLYGSQCRSSVEEFFSESKCSVSRHLGIILRLMESKVCDIDCLRSRLRNI